MSDKSSIEWTEANWNPVTGCAPANRLVSSKILVRPS
jgi:protein gp37